MLNELRPVSHSSGPDTSKEMELKLRESGKLQGWLIQTLEALKEWKGNPPTSRELGGKDNIKRQYMYARRLTDLKQLGLVENTDARICSVTGNKCLTWRVIDT